MPVLAWFVRHGSTDMSPAPEFWLPVSLNAFGKAEALDASQFIAMHTPRPEWGVSSDLPRAQETLDIAAKVLGFSKLKPMPELRAFGEDEDPKDYEKRNLKAFAALFAMALKTKKVGLIAGHRSTSAFLGKMLGGTIQKVDYKLNSLVHEGGVIVLKKRSLQPMFKFIGENSKPDLVQPFDGTQISGFVTAKDNPPPRECGKCRWMDRDHCEHPVVTADDGIGPMYGMKRNAKGRWIVAEDSCCDNFQSTKNAYVSS